MAGHEIDEAVTGAADEPASPGRRQFIQKAGAGAAIAWTLPMITSSPAAAQQGSTVIPQPFVLVGGNGQGRTFTTVDAGATYPVDDTPLSEGEVHNVAYGTLGDKWIGVGRNYGTGTPAILTSTDDGTSWSSITYGQSGRLLAIATDGAGNWVAGGEAILTFPGAALLLVSNDNGVTWQDGAFTTPPDLNTIHGIATDLAGTWIAAGQNNSGNGIIVISTNAGVDWSDPIELVTGGHVFDVAADGAGGWVAGGTIGDVTAVGLQATGGNIATVGDWTSVGAIGTGFVTGVASDRAGNYVLVGRRTDPLGPAFSYGVGGGGTFAGAFPGTPDLALHEVATDRLGNWIAVGWNGPGGPMTVYTSTDDGGNWVGPISPEASGVLLGVAAKVVA